MSTAEAAIQCGMESRREFIRFARGNGIPLRKSSGERGYLVREGDLNAHDARCVAMERAEAKRAVLGSRRRRRSRDRSEDATKTNGKQQRLHPRRFLITSTGETRTFMALPRLDDAVSDRVLDMALAEGAYGNDQSSKPRGTSKRWQLIDTLSVIADAATDIARVSPKHREEAKAIVDTVLEAVALIQRGVGGAAR